MGKGSRARVQNLWLVLALIGRARAGKTAQISNPRSSWGHPIDKIAALWSLCPELTVPEGASGTVCDQATCAVVCEPGYIGTGRRRTRCRYTKKKGFFWRRQLGKCETCSQLTPAVGMSQTCEVVKGKTRCTHTCDNSDAILTVGDKAPAKIRVRNIE